MSFYGLCGLPGTYMSVCYRIYSEFIEKKYFQDYTIDMHIVRA